MRKILTFFTFLVFVFINFSHNSVMAFDDEQNTGMSMGVEVHSSDCHDEKDEIDCDMICCEELEFVAQISGINIQNTKKKIDKFKYSFVDIEDKIELIYEWNLIGNSSPPDNEKFTEKNTYKTLTGIIKSNT